MGRKVASTDLGIVNFSSFLMAAVSPLIAGGLYEGAGVEAALFYVAGLFGVAAFILALLPLKGQAGDGAS